MVIFMLSPPRPDATLGRVSLIAFAQFVSDYPGNILTLLGPFSCLSTKFGNPPPHWYIKRFEPGVMELASKTMGGMKQGLFC